MTGLPDLDAPWDLDRPADAEHAFRRLLGSAVWFASADVLAELRSQLARALGLQGRLAEAHRELDRATATLDGDAAALRAPARIALERGRLHWLAGDAAAARLHTLEAWDLARAAGQDFHAVDALHMMALVERHPASVAWGLRALAAVRASRQVAARRWAGTIHYNLGLALVAANEGKAALRHFRAATRDYERRGDVEKGRGARYWASIVLRRLGRPGEALEAVGAACTARPATATDAVVLAEAAECLLALGRVGEAGAALSDVRALLSRNPDAPALPGLAARLAELGWPLEESARP